MMCDLLFLATVFSDTIITQVSIPVRNLVHIEVSCREADVGLGVNPNCQRVPIGDQDPLPDIILATLHNHRALDVLLSYVKLAILLV